MNVQLHPDSAMNQPVASVDLPFSNSRNATRLDSFVLLLRGFAVCFYHDDYAELYESKDVVCRKPHRCDGCLQTIQKGDPARLHTGKFDGSFFRAYECESCQRLTLSIAAEEIRHGCSWNEAWCPLASLMEYVADRDEPVQLLEGTLEECSRRVNDLWTQAVSSRRQSAMA